MNDANGLSPVAGSAAPRRTPAPAASTEVVDSLGVDALVFAGGGCRCFWQIGFLTAAKTRLALEPAYVVGVSAGSAMATILLADRVQLARECFREATAANEKNFYPERLWRSSEPAVPHLGMYGGVLREAFDAEALRSLAAGPPMDVLLARPPSWMPALPALFLGFGAYMLERRARDEVHPSWPKRVGYRPELVRVQDVIADHESDPRGAAEALVELILASSCTPPVTPYFRYGGRPVLDGGLVDNVPDFAVPESSQHALVMLTRHYPAEKLPVDPRKTIVQPSRPIPVNKWDYTSPELLEETYALGLEDGERFALGV